MIIQTGHAAEFVRSAKLTDIVIQKMHHEVGLHDALGLR